MSDPTEDAYRKGQEDARRGRSDPPTEEHKSAEEFHAYKRGERSDGHSPDEENGNRGQ